MELSRSRRWRHQVCCSTSRMLRRRRSVGGHEGVWLKYLDIMGATVNASIQKRKLKALRPSIDDHQKETVVHSPATFRCFKRQNGHKETEEKMSLP
ncbi:hypothetical protein ElyMa_005732900 [Elysia marginata]|uniref:Uncharacterized protein n=1 Tax=Elysia marginata TaxID=1093978 RepID=A0AAV4FKQ6_9GAST|nr:hypothetical protein ElyMa_005732900 [Elysia marginata]